MTTVSRNPAVAVLPAPKALGKKKAGQRPPIFEKRAYSEEKRKAVESLFLQNLDLVPRLIKIRKLYRILDNDTASQLARISIYKSALRWDPARGIPFERFAIANSKVLWREANAEREHVHVPVWLREIADQFYRFKCKNPGIIFDEYAKSISMSPHTKKTAGTHLHMHWDSIVNTASPKKGEPQDPAEILDFLAYTATEREGALFSPEEYVFAKELSRKVGHELGRALTERQRKIVRMRFGFNGYSHEKNFCEIGAAFGTSPQYAHTALNAALKKLGQSKKMKALFEEVRI